MTRTDEKTVSKLAQIIETVTAGMVCSLLGAVVGMFGAVIVWDFYYSIGAWVIEDDVYVALQTEIATGGAIIGAMSGFAIGIAFSWPGFLFVFGVNAVAVLIGCAAAFLHFSWQIGVGAVLACHLLFFGILVFRPIYWRLARKRHDRR